MFQIEALDHVAIYVQDLPQSIDWYQLVLGMEQRYRYRDTNGLGNPTVMCAGDACVALFPSSEPVVPLQGHIAMRLTRADFVQAQEHLRQHSINFNFVHYPRCDSIYFNDPTGYPLELSTYEMSG